MTRRGNNRTTVQILGVVGAAATLVAATCLSASAHPAGPHVTAAAAAAPTIIPKPVSMITSNATFTLGENARIAASGSAAAVGTMLANDLRPSTGYDLPVVSGPGRAGDITLRLAAAIPGLTTDRFGEGYRLDVGANQVAAVARTPHGLFNAVQTIRQLLPAAIDSDSAQSGPWTMRGVHIVDYPRFGYRGYMLDIARHFRTPAEVETLLDRVSEYKINTFHLHLSDDQGFRIAINGFPRLTSIGGQGSVGTEGRTMDPGGTWTQAEYRSVVAYAAARFITVVPEVDTPGHNNAIIMSEYDDTDNPLLADPHSINCSVNDPPQWNFTGAVGYSALCPESPDTWTILTAIISQLTAMSPGPYYDIGGDEVPTSVLTQDRYAALVNRESTIVNGAGKTTMGWADISGPGTQLAAGSVAEYWNPASGSSSGTVTATDAVAKGMKLVMAPANHAYVDQKYAPGVPADIGLSWACHNGCDVDQFYNWDPTTYVDNIPASSVIGVEAAQWGETTRTLDQVETLTFPRVLATAELGWSPMETRTADSPAYQDFLTRLGAQGPRLSASHTTFYASPEVPWVTG
jgi:hexosaminidase